MKGNDESQEYQDSVQDNEQPQEEEQAQMKEKDKVLYVGIDLGTSRSAISSGNGNREWIESYVGWPKDFIAEKVLGKPVLFGNEALENRLSLDVCRPLDRGVIRKGIEGSEKAVKEIIRHLIEQVHPDSNCSINAVVGVPAESLNSNKLAIKDAVSGYVNSLMVVSEPFTIAYGADLLNHSLVIDIGAGTTDFCVMHGMIPSEDDQKTLFTAGDYIDEQLLNGLLQKFPGCKLNAYMARQFKEAHSFVGALDEPVVVELSVNGKLVRQDIKEEMRRACESIVPPMVETVIELVAKVEPEFQEKVKKNIVLGGGGSLIRGLSSYLENQLGEYGNYYVRCVSDPLFGGADGALKLAQDMPARYWESL
ncbi:MAG: rod shape-determining protein [Acidobacteriota bacterium]|jgi:rod shape-determining protein MreB|nr:rod shape-determining protein [Acidobacteriota bacterium]